MPDPADLVAALDRRMPKDGSLKAWLWDVAEAVDRAPETVRRWCRGPDHENGTTPDWVDYVKLCEHFPGLRGECEGGAKELTPEQHADLAMHHMAEAKRGLRVVS